MGVPARRRKTRGAAPLTHNKLSPQGNAVAFLSPAIMSFMSSARSRFVTPALGAGALVVCPCAARVAIVGTENTEKTQEKTGSLYRARM